VAEGGGLLNRYTVNPVSWVRIPSPPPPLNLFPTTYNARGSRGDRGSGPVGVRWEVGLCVYISPQCTPISENTRSHRQVLRCFKHRVHGASSHHCRRGVASVQSLECLLEAPSRRLGGLGSGTFYLWIEAFNRRVAGKVPFPPLQAGPRRAEPASRLGGCVC
jgi:hypothetical protein